MIEILGYVVEANSSFLRVIALSQIGASCLKQLGFKEESPLSFILSIDHPNDRVKLFQQLRDSDFAFSAGREWSPSELFEFFAIKDFFQATTLELLGLMVHGPLLQDVNTGRGIQHELPFPIQNILIVVKLN